MAKDKDPKDIKFDDVDLDNELDFGMDMGDAPTTPGGKAREAIVSAGEGFMATLKDAMFDTDSIKKFLGIALPPGYSQAITAYDSAKEGLSEIYEKNEDEIRPFMAKANQLLKKNGKGLSNYLPSFIKNALEDADQQESSRYESSGKDELSEKLASLDKLFTLEAGSKAEQRIEDQRKELKDDKQFAVGYEEQTKTSSAISRLVAYQDNILINYHRKSLELNYRQYDVQHKMLKLHEAYYKDSTQHFLDIKKNTALPDYVKMQSSEVFKARLKGQLADAAVGGLAKYRKNFFPGIQKQLSEMLSGALSVVGMGTDSLGSVLETGSSGVGHMVGSTIGGFAKDHVDSARDYLASKVAPQLEKIPSLKRGGDYLRDAFADPIGWLNRFSEEDDDDAGVLSFLKGSIRNLMPRYSPAFKLNDNAIDELNDPAVFDNFFYKSVTQVMPAYLESIDKTLRTLTTGEEQEGQAWSHYTGSMVSRSTLDNQHVRVGLFEGKGNTLRDEVAKVLGTMGADILPTEARIALSRRIFKDLQSGKSFDPKDYIKVDSWSDYPAEVANELIEFITDSFELDNEGNFLGESREFTANVREAFVDASNKLPNILERYDALAKSGVIGRDVLRRTGIMDYAGNYSDVLNLDAWTNLALGEGDIDAVKKEEEKVDGTKRSVFDLKGRLSDAQLEAARKLEEALEKQRKDDEQAALGGKLDVIDTAQSSITAKPFKRLTGDKPEAVLTSGDLATILERNKGGDPVDLSELTRIQLSALSRLEAIDNNVAYINEAVLEVVTRPTGAKPEVEGPKRPSLMDKLTQFDYKGKYENAKKATVEKYEEFKKYITSIDVEERTRQLQAAAEGKYTEVSTYVRDYIESLKLDERKQFIVDAVKGKYGEVREYFNEKTTVIKNYLDDKLTSTKGYLSDKLEGAASLRDRIRSSYESIEDGLIEKIGNLDEFGQLSTADKGTHERLEHLIELLQYEREMDAAGGVERPKGRFGRILSGVGAAIGGTAKAGRWAGGKLAGYLSGSYSLIGEAAKLPLMAASSISKALFSNKSYGNRDVYIKGEDKPRIRAVDLDNGVYYLGDDKKTVLKSYKDIKAPVYDGRTGNLVISQEEIDQKLVILGDGSNLATYVGTGIGRLGLGLGKLAAWYTTGAYGLLFKGLKSVANMTAKVIRDQFTQFDAYFPGEDKPRIRSSLMEKGYYRNKDGEPIFSLDGIDGDVYDITGNLVISSDEMEKFKSLYSVNGSLLYTFGRGFSKVLSHGPSVAKGLFNYATLGIRLAGKALMGMGRGLKRGVKAMFGIKDKYSLEGFMENDGLVADILFEQLSIQAEILSMLKGKGVETNAPDAEESPEPQVDTSSDVIEEAESPEPPKEEASPKEKTPPKEKEPAVKPINEPVQPTVPPRPTLNDRDSDGVLDNSYQDIRAKIEERKRKSPNQDVVDALSTLGDRLDENFDELSSPEGGFLGTMKGWMGTLLGGGASLLGKIPGVGKHLSGALTSTVGGIADIASGYSKGGLLKGTLNAAKVLGKGALKVGWGVTKFAVRTAVPAIFKGAVAAGSAIIGAVGLPIILAGLAVGTIAYVGWKYYKKFQHEKAVPFHLRMKQYGIDPDKDEDVDRILILETMLGDVIDGVNGDEVKFNVQKAEKLYPRILRLFGVLPQVESKEQDPDVITEEEQQGMGIEKRNTLLNWFTNRFKPVYLRHVVAAKRITGQIDLTKLVDLIDNKQDMHAFLDKVFIGGGMAKYYDSLYPPKAGGVWNSVTSWFSSDGPNAEDVHEEFKFGRNVADKLKDKEEKKEEASTKSFDVPDATKTLSPEDRVKLSKPGRDIDKLKTLAKGTDDAMDAEEEAADTKAVLNSGLDGTIVNSDGTFNEGANEEAALAVSKKIVKKEVKTLAPLAATSDNSKFGLTAEATAELDRLAKTVRDSGKAVMPEALEGVDPELKGYTFVQDATSDVWAIDPNTGKRYKAVPYKMVVGFNSPSMRKKTSLEVSRYYLEGVPGGHANEIAKNLIATGMRAIDPSEIKRHETVSYEDQAVDVKATPQVKESSKEQASIKEPEPLIQTKPVLMPIKEPKALTERKDNPVQLKLMAPDVKLPEAKPRFKDPKVIEQVQPKQDVKVTDIIAHQNEARKIGELNDSMSTSNELLGQVVDKLTNIDTTLDDIRTTIPAIASQFMKQNLELAKLSGADIKSAVADFKAYEKRRNGSTARKLATT